MPSLAGIPQGVCRSPWVGTMIPAALLTQLPLIADGRPDFCLRQRHPALSGPMEGINLRRPDWVRSVHAEYFAAGARVLRTNTHAASALALGAEGLEERCEAVNNSGAACLRETVGDKAVVLGTIGQIGPIGGALPAEADCERAYGQIAVYLSDLGCDAILLDGFDSIAECLRVLRLVRGAGDAPLLAGVAPDREGRLRDATSLGQAADALAKAGADALGIVCGLNGRDANAWIAEVQAAGLPVACFLDAIGRDAMESNRHSGIPPTLGPAEFADRLAPLASYGIAILG